jgi:general secretion pathway protein A
LKTTSGPDFAQIDDMMDRGAVNGRLVQGGDPAPPDSGSLTYEPQFGLREKPFSLASDPRFFYNGSSHGASFETLSAGIRRREGILALMGEVGTGKTTLCQAVLQTLDRRIFAAFVPDPFLSREDLLKTLLVDFGVVSMDEIRNGRLRGATRTDLSYPLYDFLASLKPLKAFAVVMIDEAHNLKTDLLEEIRILSDLEKNHEKLLEVMLIGQPELQERLASPGMRQLAQRVSLRCELVPLLRDEVNGYITHRLSVAGNDGRVRFTEQAVDCVVTVSGGIPRVVNLICDRALLKAAKSGTSIVNSEHVAAAATDLRMPVNRPLESGPTVLPQGFTSPPQPSPIADLMRSPETTAAEPETATDGLASAIAVQNAPDVVRHGKGRWLVAASIALAVGGGVWATRQSLPRWLHRQQNLVLPSVEAKASPPAAAGTQTEPPLATPTPPPEQAASATAASAASATTSAVVLQMATFQSSARTRQAVQELGDAGFHAYSVELPSQDGERRLTVLLGPYAELSTAERDLDAARHLPGYDSARLVQAVPALLPPASQP